MTRRTFFGTSLIAAGTLAGIPSLARGKQEGTPVFGRTDPAKYREVMHVHHGAGGQHFQELLGSALFTSNILFVHRCRIHPKSGIGEHLHRTTEEMYFAFDRPAEFTVNGSTALLPAGSSVHCPLGYSHGIYNNSDEPLEFLNIAVSVEKGKGGAIDYNEDLASRKLVSPAPFKWARFDRRLMKSINNAHLGKGTILNNKLWLDNNFKTDWFRIGHCILPPDTSIGYHQHNATEEVYYILSGRGRMTVNDHTWDIREGDAIPCTLNDSHGLYNNTGEDLKIMVLIVIVDNSMLAGNYNADMSDEYKALNVKNWGDDLSGR